MLDEHFPIYALCFVLTFILTVLTERALIPALKREAKQPIYEGGPAWHKSKQGTPTMGGLAFLFGVTLSLLLFSLFLFLEGLKKEAVSLLICLGFSFLNSCVGIFDDAVKLKKKENAGLKPYQKIILQSVIAVLFLYMFHELVGNDTAISTSFGEIDLGVLYYPMSFIILLGITNCANLTDGIDGLASGVSFAVFISCFYLSCALSVEASLFSSAMIGASIGFLFFNIHPAKIFMGDTGSLFLGSAAACVVFTLDNPLIIVIVGCVYVIEGISVILQVLCYKLTGKRIFKMAPLHHHLEKCGWSENRICISAILLTLLTSLITYVLYLP